jgi:hypothetical protein
MEWEEDLEVISQALKAYNIDSDSGSGEFE